MTTIQPNKRKVVIKNFKSEWYSFIFLRGCFVLQADGTFRECDKEEKVKYFKGSMIWNEIFEDEILLKVQYQSNVFTSATIEIIYQPKKITREQNKAIKKSIRAFKKSNYTPEIAPDLNPAEENWQLAKAKIFFRSVIRVF